MEVPPKVEQEPILIFAVERASVFCLTPTIQSPRCFFLAWQVSQMLMDRQSARSHKQRERLDLEVFWKTGNPNSILIKIATLGYCRYCPC